MKTSLNLAIAFVLTVGSAWINPPTDERAMYGHEGPLEQNWLPREVGGWPAPYLADSPNTSVLHNVGLEDGFRAGPFIATLSFWFMLVLFLGSLVRRVRSGRSRQPTRS